MIMTKYGYAYSATNEELLEGQVESLKNYGVEELIVEGQTEDMENIHASLEKLLETVDQGDQIVVQRLANFGKSIIQLSDLLIDLEEKGAGLVVIEKAEELKDLSDEDYAKTIRSFAKMEKYIIRERTSRGLEVARKNGRIGGRPKISQETVERIQFLYNNNKYTLRQIAEECQISLGTAYKYTQDQQK